MKIARKLLLYCLFVVILVVTVFSARSAQAAIPDASGKCGDNLTWEMNSEMLNISGTGPMYDYGPENPAPWSSDEYGTSRLSRITIGHGVTSIGEYAFYHQETVGQVIIPSSITHIGDRAFNENQRAILYFLGDAPQIQGNPFPQTKFEARLCRIWDESSKEMFGTNVEIFHNAPYIRTDGLLAFPLNHVFTKDSFEYEVSVMGTVAYHPDEVTFGPYDNSTYGYRQVEVKMDGMTYNIKYFVSEYNNHLDFVEVECETVVTYGEIPEYSVQADGFPLIGGTHYTVTSHLDEAGTNGYVRFVGKNFFEGFYKTVPVTVLKRDISTRSINFVNPVGITENGVLTQEFTGMPLTPEFTVGNKMKEDIDYTFYYENNINIGTATIHVIGKGNYYGELTKDFQIGYNYSTKRERLLKGAYNGTVDNIINEDFYYEEQVVAPGIYKVKTIRNFHVDYASFRLYRFDENGDNVLVYEQNSKSPIFTYDFTSVYEDDIEQGGAVYLLAYSWTETGYKVYSGAVLMLIPSKVTDASSFIVYVEDEDGDCHAEYFSAVGTDGVLDEIQWSVSDPSIATMEDGTLTLKKPGIITLSVESNGAVAEILWEVASMDLSTGAIFEYYPKSETVLVVYDGRILEENTHYTLTREINGDYVTICATGCGLFHGQLTRTFNIWTGEPFDHIHEFDNVCDNTCNLCEYTRNRPHKYPDEYFYTEDGHWRVCDLCERKSARTNHRYALEGAKICVICGYSDVPGDFTNDGITDNADVEYLLMHTLFPGDFPLLHSGDYVKDETVDVQDVEYLLMHTLYSKDYPIWF